METKVLDFKEYNHIKYDEIKKKYNDETNPVKFTLDEFKSIVSLLFSVEFHTQNVSEEPEENIMAIIHEKYPIINITSKFVRQMIENLEDDYLDWMISLSNKSYQLSEIMNNDDLFWFIDEGLLDYMIIRKFEFGSFFLNEWPKTFINLEGNSMSTNIHEIKRIFNEEEDYLKIISHKILEKNPDLLEYEILLLTFTLKELFSKSDNDSVNYAVVNYMVRDKIHELNARIEKLQLALKNEIN